MRLGVVGSRAFNDYDLLKSKLDKFHEIYGIECIVSGGADGADKLGEKWADENGIEKDIYYPDWKKYKKAAGFIRNEDIVKNSHRVLAMWDGFSKGTKNTIELCKKYKIKCYICKYE